MTTRQRQLHDHAMRHLTLARDSMRQLMTLSSDWTAKLEVECVLTDLRDVWLSFAENQLLLDVSHESAKTGANAP
jgi:hypothetical protein